jgi:monoamine oxidase
VDPTNPVIYIIKDWTKETYIAGGQSYPKVGGSNADREALAEAIDERIFFAGEATDITGEYGTISGAIKSGERAGEEVAESIIAENQAL